MLVAHFGRHVFFYAKEEILSRERYRFWIRYNKGDLILPYRSQQQLEMKEHG
jgi:hypothetical protein